MIECRGITKAYGQKPVLKDFSYRFPERGFVLLFGESGCGKTTLLNILCGIVPFDRGEIRCCGDQFTGQVEWEAVKDRIAYITQDVYLVDYLTVLENLQLCSTDDAQIQRMLEEFRLTYLQHRLPATLSGGERQRIAILQALLANKDILLLDEPTASLDAENKRLVFQTLVRLKSDKLILCSSHDRQAMDYADAVLDFHHLPRGEAVIIPQTSKRLAHRLPRTRRKLGPFFSKWFRSGRQRKKNLLQLGVIFLLALMAVCLGDFPANKLESTIQHTYRLNQLTVCFKPEQKGTVEKALFHNKDLLDIVLCYNKSAPYTVTGLMVNETYDLSSDTIPFEAGAFRFSDHIACGSYFTKPDQVMLSYEKAKELGDPGQLIGETITLELADGAYSFEIVGVFAPFTETQEQYLRAGNIILNEDKKTIFLNSAFTDRYRNNDAFYSGLGNRTYVLYYDSYRNMKRAYEEFTQQYPQINIKYDDIDPEITMTFTRLFAILLPITLLMIPITLLFYFQTKKIEISYNRHILSVYQYYGYTKKEIRRCWLTGNLCEMLKLLLYAILVGVPLMLAVNLFNSHFEWLPFQIFTFNPIILMGFILLLLLSNQLFAAGALHKALRSGWYQLFLEHRDLI